MSRRIVAACLVPVFTVCLLTGCGQEAPRQDSKAPALRPALSTQDRSEAAEALFKRYCSPCHPDGGNVSDPQRTLHGSALKRNHITTPQDIVRIMRRPISRMIRFDAETVSDRDAMAIAGYVLTTFK